MQGTGKLAHWQPIVRKEVLFDKKPAPNYESENRKEFDRGPLVLGRFVNSTFHRNVVRDTTTVAKQIVI